MRLHRSRPRLDAMIHAPRGGMHCLRRLKLRSGAPYWPDDYARNAVDGVKLAGAGLSIRLLRITRQHRILQRGRRRLPAAIFAILRHNDCSLSSRGDYRWNGGKGRFKLDLFRGLAGVGYTALRWLNGSLPKVLIWE